MLHIPSLEPAEEDMLDLEKYLLEKLFPARERILQDLKDHDF